MRRGWSVEKFIRGGLEAARPGSYVGFLTITEQSSAVSLSDHSERVHRFLGDLWRLLGQAAGRSARDCRPLPYVGVREIQPKRLHETGELGWHSHFLILDWPRADLRAVQALAEAHGFGTAATNVKALRVGSPNGKIRNVAAYMAKTFGGYMSKGPSSDLREVLLAAVPPRGRLIVYSRRWWPGWSLTKVQAAAVDLWTAEREAADQSPSGLAVAALRERRLRKARELAELWNAERTAQRILGGALLGEPIIFRSVSPPA